MWQVRATVSDKTYNEKVLLLVIAMVVLTTVINAALMEKVGSLHALHHCMCRRHREGDRL